MLIPPINYALVVQGIYRSGHPIDLNLPFLETLGLKTILYVGERTPQQTEEYRNWAAENGIQFIHISMNSVKEPFTLNDPARVAECLEVLNNEENYPILVHSNKGKHRVGVLVGVLRKIQRWALSSIYREYLSFAKGKADADIAFIEQFELDNDAQVHQV